MKNISFALPIIVFVIGTLSSMALWHELSNHKQEAIQHTLNIKAALTHNDIQKSVEAKVLALKRMASRWEISGGPTQEEWSMDAKNYVIDNPGLTTVQWVDNTYHVRWIEPLESNEAVQDLYIAFNKERKKILQNASKKGSITLSPPLNLVQGYKAFLAYIPIHTNGQFDGFIVGVFDIKEMLDYYLSDIFAHDYYIEFYVNGKKTFQNAPETHVNHDLIAQATFKIYNETWQIKISPTDELVAQEKQTFPLLLLTTGVTVSFLLALLLHFLRIYKINMTRAKEIQHRFELAVDGAQDGIWDWPDITKDEEYWSPQFKQLLGYEDDEIEGSYKTFLSFLHPDDVEPTKRQVQEHHEKNTPFSAEYRLKNKSGEYRWFRAKATTVRDDNGNPIRMVGSIRDISQRKNTEQTLIKHAEEIRDSRVRMEAVLNTVLDGIITIDAKGVIQSINPAVEGLFHYEASEIIGQNVKMLMPEDYLKEHDTYLNNHMTTGEEKIIGSGIEVEGMRRDGSTFPIDLGINEVSISGKRMFVGTIRDISERKKAELDLIEAKDKAEGATKMKSEFLANMSHEIRTPMNGVIGMTNLLLETDLDDTQNTYALTAMSSAENLLQLVNDILDFSKIEAGKLEFEIIPFDLQMLVEEVADLIAVKAQENNLEMLLRFAPDMPRYVMGDPGRVRQVFLNLASNALKFTEVGHLLISIDFEETKSGNIEFRASIEDTGIGIPEDKQDYIFAKFSQADGSTTRKFGGTGLGLAICQELTHMMDGDIGVKSTLGIGSTFWFTFQLEPDKNASDRTALDVSADLSGIKIIIVDDNQVAQNIAAEQMQKQNMDISIASSGEEALKLMSAAAADGQPYAMGVLDYMMPGMDGFELAQTIKVDDSLKDILLLMVSSAHSRGDNERMQNVGFSGYLTKPASGLDIIRALSAIQSMQQDGSEFQLISRHMIREAGNRKNAASIENIDFNGAQILLAEDNPTNQLVATTMLEKMGCHVTPAGNGKEAVNLLKQRHFDLVFMDCNMPEMDGFEATETIRNLEDHKSLKRTPIVAFTAYAMKGDDQKCFDAGMDDYITKPVKKQSMVDVLQKWLSNDRTPKDKKGNEGNAPQNTQNDNDNATTDNGDDIDHDTFEQIKELMGEKFETMLEKYFKNSAKYITQAEKALANNDAKLLADAVHPLKSSSASLGVMRVSEIAEELELKADEIHESGKGDLTDLSLQLENLNQSLKKSEGIIKRKTASK